jgi:hypothetical protein
MAAEQNPRLRRHLLLSAQSPACQRGVGRLLQLAGFGDVAEQVGLRGRECLSITRLGRVIGTR